jgi:hypothetical protein
MDAERWKRVDDLRQSALQLPAEPQEAFLRQACADDTALLQEVQSRLTSRRKAGSFLDPPVVNVAAQLPTLGVSQSGTPSITGQTISHYHALGPRGRHRRAVTGHHRRQDQARESARLIRREKASPRGYSECARML